MNATRIEDNRARYAVYYAPEDGCGLDRFGSRWLGRCAVTGRELPQPEVPDVGRDELGALTAPPRHYGFHGTLVPPFHLREDYTPGVLLAYAAETACELAPVDMGVLELREIGAFLALTPAEPACMDAVRGLHEECLKRFHVFRDPPSLAEMERRRSRGLTPAQERLLSQWGYPYVLEEFRFHLTLTDSIPDRQRRKRLMRFLEGETKSLRNERRHVGELCLFYQANRAEPFTIAARLPMRCVG